MRLISALLAGLFLAALARGAAGQDSMQKDRARILEGVERIGAPGSPGALVAYGKEAFAVVVGEQGSARAAVVAAARAGSGRLVGFAHDGYLHEGAVKELDTGKLVLGALRWAAGAVPRTGPGARVLVWSSDLSDWLGQQGLRATPQQGALEGARLADFDVVLLGGPGLSENDVAALAKYLRGGGGVVAAQTAWGWLQGARGLGLQENPLNRIFSAAGLAWTGAICGKTLETGYDAREEPAPLVHALAALDAIAKSAAEFAPPERTQAEVTLGLAFESVPQDDPWLQPRVRALLEQHRAELCATPEHPIRASQVLLRVLARLELRELERMKPLAVRAAPSSASFPGEVPAGAKPVTRKLAIELSVPGWHSTGLYAAPGAALTVDIARDLAGKQLALRIGCHTDALWNLEEWKRMPAITRSVPLAQPTTQVANAFGGPVYLEVPEGLAPGAAQVLVRGAIEAPLFVLGETSLEEWKSSIRTAPAPWAEIGSSKIFLSVPSECVRTLDDPQALMEFWGRISDAMRDLSGLPHPRVRPERFVADVQISAGYMHSGYPIMTHADAGPWMVDLAHLRRGEWGLLHELGHNHQNGLWTFEGTGEVTNNVFACYVLQTVCGVDPADVHEGLRAGPQKLEEYLAQGASFERWCADPFLALHMYRQLIAAFGWDTYKRVIVGYRDPANGPAPKTEAEKRDQWLTRYSRAAAHDLGPFFRAWGVSVSDEACLSVSTLPPWMPSDFPKH
ncbi:MAG: hypothetical protein IPJ19_14560 [Planctomycetes bacterium]|nr:hypothetical protein [Planctomycetota bacterium]